jgi:AbrB family looped-hinge helix DNA binding protein
MPTSTLTSKGQTTIPREVRDHLNLQAGDKLDFILRDDGLVLLQPANIDLADLKGVLFQPGRRPVSLEDMKTAVRRRQQRER